MENNYLTFSQNICILRGDKMVNYDYYEELEEQAYNDKISRKKKPKKQKKSYKKEEVQNVKRDKKNSWSSNSRRI